MLSNVQRSNMMLTLSNCIILDEVTPQIPDDENVYYCIQALDDTVFESIKNTMCVNKPDGLEGVAIPGGMILTGNFKDLVLTSGIAICYIRKKYKA